MYPFLWNLTTHVVMMPTPQKRTQNWPQNLPWLYFRVKFWSNYLWSDFDMKYTFWNILTFKEDNGDIFARGTQDMKSVGIQHIEAIYRLKVLQKKKFKRTIHMWWVKDTIYLFSECTWCFVKFDMIFYLEDVGSKTLLLALLQVDGEVFSLKTVQCRNHQFSLHF